jgi:hypothetical protein
MPRGLHGALHAVLLAAALAAAPAYGQVAITLYGGVMGSSGLSNATDDASVQVKSGAAWAAAAGTLADGGREIQLMYAQQATTVNPGGGAAPFDLTVRYLHLGGTVFVDGPIDRGFYVAGGLGATQFAPNFIGYGNAYRASFNLGLGYYWPITKNVALRAEGRGFLSLVNSSGGFLCSGGCVVVLKSDFFAQYAGLLGVTATF